MANSFFQRGYSSSPLGKLLMKSFGWANAGIDALNLANSAFGATNRTGNALSTLGGVVGSIPTPYTQIIGAGLGAAGALVNGFTDKVNEAHKNAVNSQINNLALTNSNASDYQGLQLDYKTLMNNHIELGDLKDWGDIGIFSNGKKVRRAREDARQGLLVALQTALNNLNARGLEINQMNFANLFLNLMAFGGPMMDFGNGAIGYSFMNRYIQSKENPEFNDKITSMPNSFTPMPELSTFAYGGNMGAYGADWTNGLTHINNGGTHEQNPFEGVQIGVDQEGTPNLVEEGEVVWNDYVFSNRLKVPNRFKEANKLKDSIVTFADAAREFSKESEERPNDPISKRGLDAAMSNLASQLEQIRVANERRKYARGGKLGRLYDGTEQYSNNLRSQVPIVAPNFSGITSLFSNIGDWLEGVFTPNPVYIDTSSEAIDSSRINISDTGEAVVPTVGNYVTPSKGNVANTQPKVATRPYINMSSENLDNSLTVNLTPTNFRQQSPIVQETDAERKARVEALANADFLAREAARRQQFRVLTADERAGANRVVNTAATTKVENPVTTSNVSTPTTSVATPVQNTAPTTSSAASPATTLNSPKKSRVAANPVAAQLQLPMTISLMYDTIGFSIPQFLNANKPVDIGNLAPAISPIDKELLRNMAKYSNEALRTRPTVKSGLSLQDNKQPDSIEANSSSSNNLLPTWMRYTPVLGSAIGLMQGLASRPDYSNANMILSAAERAGQIGLVGYNPIGNYLSYNPLDSAYQSNLINALAAATRRAIQQLANGNIGATMSGLLATDFNNLNALGEAYREATLKNLAQRKEVELFNRATNQVNSEMGLKAAMANLGARMKANTAYMSGIAQAAQMRQTADLARSQGISTNFTNLILSIGDIGKENMARNMVVSSPGIYYSIGTNGEITYKNGFDGLSEAEKLQIRAVAEEDRKNKGYAGGGYLTIKGKKKGRR